MKENPTGKKADENAESNAFIIGSLLLVLPLWLTIGWYLPHLTKNAAEFGDMFGGVSALFSGLAFAGIIYTIRLQREELKLQRDELILTRDELKGQKEQLEAQNQTFKRQAFENTFFQLLKQHNEIVSAMKIDDGNIPRNGKDCFIAFYNRFQEDVRQNVDLSKFEGPPVFGEIYEKHFYPNVEQDLGHYFRSLYNIIKLIDQSEINDKRLYTNIVRAQLSKHELLLLFYNCISNLGENKFKPLIENYALLKMLQTKNIVDPKHRMFYSATAYAGQ